MQAETIKTEERPYNWAMPSGRPTKQLRTPFGERLNAARLAAGLSQAQVADKLGIHQSSYADWERYPVALRPDQLQTLAELCGVRVEELIDQPRAKRGQGPTGKMRHLFTAASNLPRDQQQKGVALLEAFVEKHAKAS